MYLCKFVEKNLDSYAGSKAGVVKKVIIREHLDSCSSSRTKYESIAGVSLTPHPNVKGMKEQTRAQELTARDNKV